jgi:hypothetical protein
MALPLVGPGTEANAAIATNPAASGVIQDVRLARRLAPMAGGLLGKAGYITRPAASSQSTRSDQMKRDSQSQGCIFDIVNRKTWTWIA